MFQLLFTFWFLSETPISVTMATKWSCINKNAAYRDREINWTCAKITSTTFSLETDWHPPSNVTCLSKLLISKSISPYSKKMVFYWSTAQNCMSPKVIATKSCANVLCTLCKCVCLCGSLHGCAGLSHVVYLIYY